MKSRKIQLIAPWPKIKLVILAPVCAVIKCIYINYMPLAKKLSLLYII